MSSPGILLLLVGAAGLVALFSGNLDRALERLTGTPPTSAAVDLPARSRGGSWEAEPTTPATSSSSGVQTVRAAYAAGFRGEQLVTAVAIAKGESGWRADAEGDVGLANDKWGPSIGLWQIRSLRADTGTGRDRDAAALRDPTFNARAAWSISSGGSNWRPWTVYTSGAYRAHIGAARAAIAAAGVSSPPGVVPL